MPYHDYSVEFFELGPFDIVVFLRVFPDREEHRRTPVSSSINDGEIIIVGPSGDGTIVGQCLINLSGAG